MPRKPRAKRSTTAAGHVELVSKNANGDGSVYFEPARRHPLLAPMIPVRNVAPRLCQSA